MSELFKNLDNKSILITGHVNPDGDALGAALSFKIILNELDYDADVCFDINENLPSNFDHLPLDLIIDEPAEKYDKVFVFGDSMTFGVGLKYENTVVGILDKKISSYHFHNFAMGSYSPTVHFYKLQQALKKNLYPKKIVLLLDLSDIYDEGARWHNDNGSKPQLRTDSAFNSVKSEKKFTHKNLQVSRLIASVVNSNLRVLRNKIKNLGELNDDNSQVKTSIQGAFTYRDLKSINDTYWSEEIFSLGVKKIKKKLLIFQIYQKKITVSFI